MGSLKRRGAKTQVRVPEDFKKRAPRKRKPRKRQRQLNP